MGRPALNLRVVQLFGLGSRALRFLAIAGKRVQSYDLDNTGIEERSDEPLLVDRAGGRWATAVANAI